MRVGTGSKKISSLIGVRGVGNFHSYIGIETRNAWYYWGYTKFNIHDARQSIHDESLEN